MRSKKSLKGLKNASRKGNKMNYLAKTPKSYNSYYKTYRAEWCRKSGLPMYSRKNFDEVQSKGLYTATRAAKEKVSIDESVVCGWYRLPNGYTPLFRERQENGKS